MDLTLQSETFSLYEEFFRCFQFTVYSLYFIFLLARLEAMHKFDVDVIASGCR